MKINQDANAEVLTRPTSRKKKKKIKPILLSIRYTSIHILVFLNYTKHIKMLIGLHFRKVINHNIYKPLACWPHGSVLQFDMYNTNLTTNTLKLKLMYDKNKRAKTTVLT